MSSNVDAEKQRDHAKSVYLGWIKDTAARFVLHDWYINEYGCQPFLEFLMHETEERWALPSYFVAKFDRPGKLDDAMSDLSTLMGETLEHDVLFEEYLKDTFTALRECFDEATLKPVEELISIFERAKEAKDEDEECDLVEIVKHNEYSARWAC